MKRNRVLFCLFFLILLFSCKTSLIITGVLDESYLYENRIVYFQTSLSLPSGWVFQKPQAGDKEGVVLRFFDNEGTVSGTFEYVSFDFEISGERLFDLYCNIILGDFEDKRTGSGEIDGKETYFIRADKRGVPSIMVMIIVEGTNANIIEVVAPKWYFDATTEIVYNIFKSYSLVQEEVSQRTVKDTADFYCYDGSWAWLADNKDGFFIGGKVQEKNCLVGIWLAEEESTEEFYENQDSFNIPLFDAIFFINNGRISTRGTGFRDPDGFLNLYYILNFMDKNYCLFFKVDNEDIPPEDFHNSDDIIDLFRFNLIFH